MIFQVFFIHFWVVVDEKLLSQAQKTFPPSSSLIFGRLMFVHDN